MSKRKLSTSADRAEALGFVLSECRRIQNALATAAAGRKLKDLPREDFLCDLPSPDGRGHLMCGRAAYDALIDLATHTLRASPCAETAELDHVFAAVKTLVSTRFLSGQEELTPVAADRVLADALAEASAKRRDTRHFIPCRLMYARNPDRFTVGPVTFRTIERFEADLGPGFSDYSEREADAKARAFSADTVAYAKTYYNSFPWAADVLVLGCAPKISTQRAFLAIQSAVNVLSLLFGHYRTRRMTVGGPPLASMDKRAHITQSGQGDLSISWSTGSTSASGFEDGWEDFFSRPNISRLLDAGGKAILPIVDPSLSQPLAARFVDAISWFGEAMRERSPASQIVKAITAIERLVMAERTTNVTQKVTNRAAMLHADYVDTDFFDLRKKVNAYYDLRSDLAHGRSSPFDPTVADAAPACLKFAERTLLAGLGLFHSANVLDQALTNEDLAAGYDQLVEQAKRQAEAQRRGQTHR